MNLEDEKNVTDLIDYYCPFCNQKLFKGKVANFNMVCSGCNRLVKSQDFDPDETEEQS